MKIGRVIGRIVLSKKDENLSAGNLLIVSPFDKSQFENSDKKGMSKLANLVVFDNLGASDGDVISYVEGAEATAPFDKPIPIDAYNVGIVERVNYRP